jgi:hypothetical protein
MHEMQLAAVTTAQEAVEPPIVPGTAPSRETPTMAMERGFRRRSNRTLEGPSAFMVSL